MGAGLEGWLLIGAIDSVAIAVRDLATAVETFSAGFGLVFEKRHEIAEHHVVTTWADFGGVSLQLLAPTGEDSPVEAFLRERGEGLLGVTLRVDDLEAARDKLVASGLARSESEVVDAGYAKEIPLRPSRTHGVLFVLRAWER